MKGIKFELDSERISKYNLCTQFGWINIEVVERYVKSTSEYTDESVKKSIINYEWLVIAYSVTGDSDFVSIDEDEFMEELSYGIYKFSKN